MKISLLRLQWSATRLSFQMFSGLLPRHFGRWAARIFLTPLRFKRPQWEEEILAKAEATEAGANFRAYLFGTSGPLVLFAHGWSGRGSQFGRFVEPLLERGYRVVLFDGPAHFSESLQKTTDIREYAEALIECQKRFGPLQSVMGHSFGGAAVGLAIKFGLDVRSAVFLATPGDLEKVFERFSRRLRIHPRAKIVFYNTAVDRIGLSEKQASIVSIGPEMTMPALIIHDPQDFEVPFSHALHIQEAWPEAKLVVVHRVGHYRILKAPAVIQSVVDFIDNLS